MDRSAAALASAVYKRLEARPDGELTSDLCRIYEVDEPAMLACLAELERKHLAVTDNGRVRNRRWQNQPHLSLRFEIPRVSDSAFDGYTRDLDDLCTVLRQDGIDAVRPPTGEVEIILAVATFAGGVLATAFLTKIAERIATFVGNVVTRRRADGIDAITIRGRVRLADDTFATFTVSGSDAAVVVRKFDEVRDRLSRDPQE